MNLIDQVPMFEDLPQTDEPKKRIRQNKMSEVLIKIMKERNLTAKDISIGSGVPVSTIHDWAFGGVGTQLADNRLFAVARFLDVSTEFLCLGEENKMESA